MMCVSCLSHEFSLSCSESPLENGEKKKLVSYLYYISKYHQWQHASQVLVEALGYGEQPRQIFSYLMREYISLSSDEYTLISQRPKIPCNRF